VPKKERVVHYAGRTSTRRTLCGRRAVAHATRVIGDVTCAPCDRRIRMGQAGVRYDRDDEEE
jgi:hypothetical protein